MREADIEYADTRFNWELSKHIFRYGHGNMIGGGLGGIHTVNERAFFHFYFCLKKC
jgi:hypothetical protein